MLRRQPSRHFLTPFALATSLAVFAPSAHGAEPVVNPAPTITVSKTVQTACSWTLPGETEPRSATVEVEVRATVPTSVPADAIVQARDISSTLKLTPEATAGMGGRMAVRSPLLTSNVVTFGQMRFDLTWAAGSGSGSPYVNLNGTPVQSPSEGVFPGFAAGASSVAIGQSVPLRYREFTIALYSRVPYAAWLITCAATGDATIADVPVTAPIRPVVSGIGGWAFGGFGGVLEVRGTVLGAAKTVAVGGKRAAFVRVGSRLLVLAPPLPRGSHQVILSGVSASSEPVDVRYR